MMEAEAEITKCITTARYFSSQAEEWLLPRVIQGEARYMASVPEPLGPILAIMPWNFPLWQLFRFGASALAAGDTIVLKHAPNVPGCAEAIVDLCAAAGLPEGVITNVFARVDQLESLVADPRIAALTLTGSTRAGRAVAALAGR